MSNTRHLFGPVPSRRLGLSLGIDLVPYKTCTLDCIYCESGATTRLQTEREIFFPSHIIKKELEEFWQATPKDNLPAYYTFSGSGEPTLAANIGEIIRFIKEQKPEAKVAVLTNGTLLWQKEVRLELLLADLVMPSLDAALPETLKRINRPAKGFSVEKWVEGLKSFRNEYKGTYHLEIFIIPELNTSKAELEEFKRLILEIKPDKVQLNSLDRPGVLFDLVKAPKALLEEIIRFWNIPHVEIIGNYKYEETLHGGEGKDFLKNFILGLIKRRPCTISDLVEVSGKKTKEVSLVLEILEKEGSIMTEMKERGVFYRLRS